MTEGNESTFENRGLHVAENVSFQTKSMLRLHASELWRRHSCLRVPGAFQLLFQRGDWKIALTRRLGSLRYTWCMAEVDALPESYATKS